MTRPAIFLSLRFKFALLLALFSGALMLGAMVLLEQDIRQSLISESIRKGIGIAKGVAFNAEDPLITGDDLYLFSAVNNAVKSPGVRYAVITDEQGVVKASDTIDRVGRLFELPGEARREGIEAEYPVMRIPRPDHDILDLSVPIVSVADPSLQLGAIHLGLSERVITEAVKGMQHRLAALALVALVLGSVSAYLLASFSVRPVNALVQGVRAIGSGNLDQRIEMKRNDELGVLTDAFNEMAESLREKEFIKNTFERYVSKPLARQILQNKESIELGGEEREITILFSDIRRFTSLSEQLPPGKVVELLNNYFNRMIEVVIRHEGMVDKMMGDSVMALFGAPLTLGEDPLRAVRCAVEMQQALAGLNEELSERGEPPLQMGVGINTGPVVAGNIGSSMRMEYTVIGDNVNIAARLQGIAGPGQVLISENTYRQVKDHVEVEAMPPMTLKGKSVAVGVYRILGLSA